MSHQLRSTHHAWLISSAVQAGKMVGIPVAEAADTALRTAGSGPGNRTEFGSEQDTADHSQAASAVGTWVASPEANHSPGAVLGLKDTLDKQAAPSAVLEAEPAFVVGRTAARVAGARWVPADSMAFRSDPTAADTRAVVEMDIWVASAVETMVGWGTQGVGEVELDSPDE